MKQSIVRIRLLRILAALAVFVLVYNLFHIQVVEGEVWANMADNNRFRHLVQVAPRGNILTSDGVVLAQNLPGYDVALAYEFDRSRREQAIATLSELLNLDYDEVYAKVASHSRRFEPVVVARNIEYEQLVMLEECRHLIPGLVIQVNPRRHYPEPYLFSHGLGRVIARDYVGSQGLEKQWEEYLSGQDGNYVIQVDADSRPVGDAVYDKVAIPGNDLHLTLDAGLQRAAQASLQRVLAKLRENNNAPDAWAGAVVVLDPNTGRILAMVSEPTYDVNDPRSFAADGIEYDDAVPSWARTHFLDRTINYRKPVGSTIKMLTGMAALESGVVSANERILCRGHTRIDNQPTSCYARAAHGNVNMVRALEVSCNIYFGTLGARLGRDRFYQYLEIFGMGWEQRNAGFADIPQDEQRDALDYRRSRWADPWVGGHNVQIGYGQLNEFTPMQLANYVAMIANGGIHYRPYLVERITDHQGEVVEQFAPEIIAAHEFNPANLKLIREGMLAAGNTNYLRGIKPRVAGKTGTAEDGAGSPHAWWVGYGPYDDPEIVVAIFLERGTTGWRATEVARDIFDYWYQRQEQQ